MNAGKKERKKERKKNETHGREKIRRVQKQERNKKQEHKKWKKKKSVFCAGMWNEAALNVISF